VRLSGKKPKGNAYPKEVTTIGDAIRKRRLDLGLHQKDVAKMIGCDKTSVLNWEKGYNTPRVNKMADIERFLGAH
jgi:transcriptional regulator with XRE-family HTH domain